MDIYDKLNVIKKNLLPILKKTNFIKKNKLNNLKKLDKLYFLMKKYNKINTFNISLNNILTTPISLSKRYNKFIPKSATIYIFNNIKKQYKITLQLKNREINIYISNDKPILKNKLDKLINKTIYIIKTLDDLTIKQPNNLDLFIYLSKEKKIFPKNKNDELTSKNVNSGYTAYFTNNHREIVVYREEELIKVLIHELIHYYDFDIKTTINFMENKLFIKNCLKLYGETYTDIWARILNIMFIAVEKTDNYDDYIKFLQISLYIEILFSYFQGFKTLNHFNITYDMLRNEIDEINNYKETSNGYCYYVLPSILLSNIDLFIELCYTNNKVNIVTFNKNNDNRKDFILLILKILNSYKFKKIEELMSQFSIANNTMRMSIIE